jgi:hypothetical protein
MRDGCKTCVHLWSPDENSMRGRTRARAVCVGGGVVATCGRRPYSSCGHTCGLHRGVSWGWAVGRSLSRALPLSLPRSLPTGQGKLCVGEYVMNCGHSRICGFYFWAKFHIDVSPSNSTVKYTLPNPTPVFSSFVQLCSTHAPHRQINNLSSSFLFLFSPPCACA